MFQISAHPLSEHKVMCTAQGPFSVRTQLATRKIWLKTPTTCFSLKYNLKYYLHTSYLKEPNYQCSVLKLKLHVEGIISQIFLRNLCVVANKLSPRVSVHMQIFTVTSNPTTVFKSCTSNIMNCILKIIFSVHSPSSGRKDITHQFLIQEKYWVGSRIFESSFYQPGNEVCDQLVNTVMVSCVRNKKLL